MYFKCQSFVIYVSKYIFLLPSCDLSFVFL